MVYFLANFGLFYLTAYRLSQEVASEYTDNENVTKAPDAEINAGGITSRAYSVSNAIAYAYTYTTDSYSAQSGNNSSFLNTNFFDYSSIGGNCQNFVSQCIWAGFGGSNDVSSINNFRVPMDRSGSYQWYGDKFGNKSSSWSTCSYFYDYAVASNNATGETGFRSTVNTFSNAMDLSSVVNSLPGSAMLVYAGGDSKGHAIFIVSASSGTDVRYCGNSPMRKNYKVSDETYASRTVYIIRPTSFRETSSCTHTYGSSSTGTSCKCTQCGYSRLVVTGNMQKCIARGNTVAISGSANYTCYRMAMGITTPSGTTTWTEVLSTKTISRNYTFSEKGLYTIRVSGRDISDSETNSVAYTHVFTIRVY